LELGGNAIAAMVPEDIQKNLGKENLMVVTANIIIAQYVIMVRYGLILEQENHKIGSGRIRSAPILISLPVK
jgi:hypothetical protein